MGRYRDLNSLRCFVAVAKAQNFSLAAKHLGLPKSFVSRKVQELEADLQTTLFRRGTRKTALIESAIPFFQNCAAALDRIDLAAAELEDLGAKTKIRISATTDIGAFVLVPIIEREIAGRESVEIEYILSDQVRDVFDESLDFSIRMLNVKDDRLVARDLGSIEVGLFEGGRVQPKTSATRTKKLALFKSESHSVDKLIGESQALAQITDNCDVTYTNSVVLIRELVLNHAYQAFLPVSLVKSDLRARRLRLSKDSPRFSIGRAYLVYAKDRFSNPVKVKIRDRILSELRKAFQSRF